MHLTLRNFAPLLLAACGLTAWTGCETYVTTDAPPPSGVDVQVERPGVDVDVDVQRKPGGIDVDVERKPGGVDVDIDRNKPVP